jgi:hypothetical protein
MIRQRYRRGSLRQIPIKKPAPWLGDKAEGLPTLAQALCREVALDLLTEKEVPDMTIETGLPLRR